MRLALLLAAVAVGLSAQGPIQVAPGGRYLQTSDGKPFFWLGDTAWTLFHKLTREETIEYLDDRQRKGFNVIQVMVLRASTDATVAGDAALIDEDPARPKPGGYWDHAEWVIDRARERGMHIGLVCAWGSVVKSGKIHAKNVEAYSTFLAERFRSKPNIVWIVGGDVRGDQGREVWQAMGRTLRRLDRTHLITYHPFGRTQSSTWFHDEPWLDFNMFQSGHRRYDQDDTPNPKGEDNWRYVQEDWARTPPKPTLDGEPSYENLPQGLHDPKEPYWTAADVRRYAWWSVLSGACGHTYGENAVIQLYKPGAKPAFGVRTTWREGIASPGSTQMQFLKQLILSRPFFERVPDLSLIAGENGTRHDYVAAMRGRRYAYLYTWTGRSFRVACGRIEGAALKAAWMNPRTGEQKAIGTFANKGTLDFDPPGDPAPGNDWVLILDGVEQQL